jgi:nucleoside 2-deoxyribosyltransferase
VVRVNLQPLRNSAVSPIRRIDGNHRLEAAHRLAEELTRSATFKNFATAPFCFVILNSDRPEDDDLKVFKKDYEGRARSVFVAMSFHEDQTLKSVRQAIDEAIQQFNTVHPNAPLSPVRVDEQGGASYEIPARVFQEIDQSTLVIADLTDERPNVYCEVGYAKSRGIPFILTFHKKDSAVGPPWDRQDEKGNRVHFDLAASRYVLYDNPLQLRDLLKEELNALFEEGLSSR